MNKIGFLLVLLTTKWLFAQEKNVGDFTKVTAFDQIDVMLIPSDENKVSLNGSGSDEVELINKNGELKIRMPLTKMLSGDAISALVYYTQLNAVEANEGARIVSESVVSSEDFDIITRRGSIVELTLDVKNLIVKMNDGSKVSLEEKADSQDVLLNSGSVYKAEKLQTNSTIITANTGAEGSVRVSDLADAKMQSWRKSLYLWQSKTNQ